MNVAGQGPSLVLSTRSSPLLRYAAFWRAAAGADLVGLDVDVTNRTRTRLLGLPEPGQGGVRSAVSLWVRPEAVLTQRPRWEPWQGSGHIPATVAAHLIVVDVAHVRRGTDGSQRQLAAARSIREALGAHQRVALAVRPGNPEDVRAHLTRVRKLRSVAEEWDLDLALDAASVDDWLWEAEASVFQMMPRLRLIRFTFSVPPGAGSVRSRLTHRTLTACKESTYRGILSLVAPLPCWRWRDEVTLERACVEAADRIEAAFGIVRVPSRHRVPQRSPG